MHQSEVVSRHVLELLRQRYESLDRQADAIHGSREPGARDVWHSLAARRAEAYLRFARAARRAGIRIRRWSATAGRHTWDLARGAAIVVRRVARRVRPQRSSRALRRSARAREPDASGSDNDEPAPSWPLPVAA